MNNSEAIAAVRAGERAVTDSTMKDFAISPSECGSHRWRVVACDDKNDVAECRLCGKQTIMACTFNEEFS